MKEKILVLLCIYTCSISTTVFAETKSTSANDFSSCMKISNNEKRLSCFDNLVIKEETTINAKVKIQESESDIVKLEANQEEAKRIDDFAKDDLNKPFENQGLDSITGTISDVKQLIRGQWVISLENGQKWQQHDSGKIILKVGDDVRLKKGVLGAVYLFKVGSHRNIRVKRLK
jgi:hypothetical protein